MGAAMRAYDAGMNETSAATTRHPSSMRAQVWLWRPRRPDSTRWNSVLAVAKVTEKRFLTKAHQGVARGRHRVVAPDGALGLA